MTEKLLASITSDGIELYAEDGELLNKYMKLTSLVLIKGNLFGRDSFAKIEATVNLSKIEFEDREEDKNADCF